MNFVVALVVRYSLTQKITLEEKISYYVSTNALNNPSIHDIFQAVKPRMLVRRNLIGSQLNSDKLKQRPQNSRNRFDILQNLNLNCFI
jgi:hypothetical protein